jgi:hypothetical protein
LSSSSAWLAPLNRGSLNSAHIHGTDVPVEEPSTASTTDFLVYRSCLLWFWSMLEAGPEKLHCWD